MLILNFFIATGRNAFFCFRFKRAICIPIIFLLATQTARLQEYATRPDTEKIRFEQIEKNSIQMSEKPACPGMKSITDETKGTITKMMTREKIIAFTPDKLKEIFTDSDYLEIEANLNNFNGAIALLLKITIHSNKPDDIYGAIYKDSKLFFKLTSGETVVLQSGQSDSGVIDPVSGTTTFMTFYSLDESAVELLKSAGITKARLHWQKGYEDYVIKVPDFFTRQLACVE